MPTVNSLVTTDWLHQNLHDPNTVIIDCTNFAEFDKLEQHYKTVSGYKNWQASHIPDSRHADFSKSFSDPESPYRNTLPEPEHFRNAIAALGVSDKNHVVLYDNACSMWAARVWWMLRWIGFDRASVLDGGWQAWTAQVHPVSSELPEYETGKLSLDLHSEFFVTKAELATALNDKSVLLIDALSESQFNGTQRELGLCGHIPGARNVPATALLNSKSGCYFELPQLAEFFPTNNFQRTIVYCGSGIAAASVAFSLTRLGFQNVAIYMPGLQEWVHDPSAPLINGNGNASISTVPES